MKETKEKKSDKSWNPTREEWRAILMDLLRPLYPHYSEGGGRLRIGHTNAHYEVVSQEMEAFARPLWGFAPFLYGAEKEELQDEEVKKFLLLYRDGLRHGTDPEHPDYWGPCHDFDQKFCEMPALALFLLLDHSLVFDDFSEEEKSRIADWLNEINRHDCCACNWYFFSILTNVALKRLGLPYSETELQKGLSLIDSYYDAGGWYNDGNGGDKDYYNPYVMLTFGLLYRHFMNEEDPERCARYHTRALCFAKDYQFWFSDSGAAFAYGRSMTYRFASAAFWSVCLFLHVEVLPVPIMKGILYRNLHDWLQRPIYDNAGILSIGYGYPNLQMSESYNGPGSPYWALMAFLFLGIPKEDPFWKCEAAPMPSLPLKKFLSNVPMIMQRSAVNPRQVVALVPGKTDASGHGHMIEKYSKFAYSSAFSFSIARSEYSLPENAPDSTLAFILHGLILVKNQTEPGFQIDDGHIVMHWSPFPGLNVCTTILPTEKGHKRIHEIENLLGETIEAYDTGFSVPVESDTIASVVNNADNLESHAALHSSIGYCRVSQESSDALHGFAEILTPDPNTNLLYPKTRIPLIHYSIPEGKCRLETLVSYL